MKDYPFNPFRKNLDALSAEDLAVLKEVSEGWYIEYKRQDIGLKEYAKSLAAFANQYGGFLFIGIEEDNNGSRKAGIFHGVSQGSISKISLKIREAATTHVNPPVFFEERIIDGPCEEITLAEGQSVIVIGIPQGSNPPYIHSSGSIYRRLADSAEPKAETDRHILDMLWRRGRERKNEISKFLTTIPELPLVQRNNVWAFVYLTTNGEYPPPEEPLSFDVFQSYTLDCRKKISKTCMPMQTAYSAPGGYIARQVEHNDPGLACATFRWWHNGIARFEIPVNQYSLEGLTQKQTEYRHANTFVAEYQKQRFRNIDIVDFSYLIHCLATLSNLYIHLCKEVRDTRPVYAIYELINLFYKVPFLNSSKYMERCAKYGIPLIQDRIIKLDDNPYYDNMIPLSLSDEEVLERTEEQKKEYPPYDYAVMMAVFILKDIGIMTENNDFLDDEIWGNND